MAEEVNLIVARVRIAGDIEIEEEENGSIRAGPGDRILVKLPYRYDEVSTKKDDFRIQLSSEFAGQSAEPALHAHEDRRGIADDQRGFVVQEYVAPGPGEYVLTFRAAAEYVDDGDRQTLALEGSIPVQVDATAPPPL